MSNDDGVDLAAGCISFLIKLVLIIWLWSELDALLPEKWDTAIGLTMLLFIL